MFYYGLQLSFIFLSGYWLWKLIHIFYFCDYVTIIPLILLYHAAAAKSIQSCPAMCDPIDGSPPGSPSLGFSRQEHWSGLPFPSPGGSSPPKPGSPALQADSLPLSHQGSHGDMYGRIIHVNNYLKCKWIKCSNQKTKTSWVDENMCMYAFPFITSLYLTLQIVCNYFILLG